MAFTDHKISAFTHKIADLADQPNMPPDELKARFDACPEQLRVSLNAVCDEAAALDSKVGGILTQTFEGAIDKSMLSPALVAELDSTVTQAELDEEADARVAETAAREAADSALSTRLSSAENTISSQATQISQRCRVYIGTYTGNGAASRTISLGFKPKAVLVVRSGCSFGALPVSSALAVENGEAAIVSGAGTFKALTITSSGFTVYYQQAETRIETNVQSSMYTYVAFR